MAENSSISWTDNTLNFWWGCMKVSEGCKNCYAETFSKRWGKDIWGPNTDRPRTKQPWKDILKWDIKAGKEGKRLKVFCQSMSDFFEDHPILNEVNGIRSEAKSILLTLQNIDIQLLTKRPENIMRMMPNWCATDWPEHIWIGTSVENQEQADKRIPKLLKVPAKIRFLSCEPLLEAIDLRPYLHGVHWVIVGGESGHNARAFAKEWADSLLSQCQDAGVPFFMKQFGSKPFTQFNKNTMWSLDFKDKKGETFEEFPECLKVRDFPITNHEPNKPGQTRL